MKNGRIFWKGGERWIVAAGTATPLLKFTPYLESEWRKRNPVQPDEPDMTNHNELMKFENKCLYSIYARMTQMVEEIQMLSIETIDNKWTDVIEPLEVILHRLVKQTLKNSLKMEGK